MNSNYGYNFSKTAQTRFNKLVENKNWSWMGLALALIKRFGIGEIEDFNYILTETLTKLRKDLDERF